MRMAASSAQRSSRPCKLLALVLVASLFAGVKAQEEEVATVMMPSPVPEANVQGDMIPQTPKDLEQEDQQVVVFPTVPSVELTTQATVTPKESGDLDNNAAPEKVAEFVSEAQTALPKVSEAETNQPQPPRGDGPANRAQVVVQDDVICVSQEAVRNRNAVSLKLKTSSSCENTRAKLQSVIQDLCGEDCKLEIFQEDRSDETIVSGNYVEADVSGMTSKFNDDNIKDKTGVENAVTRWRQKSKLVLVSLLLTGLLLAALLVAGYYLQTHRKNSKGVRLAESFQVDEENQANTLVSVAPLPQEPLDKATVNTESPPENGTSPTTNGHSASGTPVADTEM